MGLFIDPQPPERHDLAMTTSQFARINGPTGHADVTYTNEKILHIMIYRGHVAEVIPANPPRGLQLLIEFIQQFPNKPAEPIWPYLDFSSCTEFTKKILEAVFAIPKGTQRTYGDIARLVTGHSAAARAVGSVMRKNAFPMVIPCHRIIKSDGSLGAYCGAPENSENDMRKEPTKSEILKLEQEDQGFVLMQLEMDI